MISVVLTGTSCCGKTTIIELLGKTKGTVVEEVARKLAMSKEIDSFSSKEAQLKLFNAQLKAESVIMNSKYRFLDRSLIDSLAYCKFHLGYVLEDMKKIDYKKRYDFTFILRKLPFVEDGVRKESESQRELIENMLIEEYQSQGCNPIIVPVMPPEERIEFILSHIKYEDK